jgi:uncharacterized protein involved in exopolysaccharide biosynthesis
MDLENSYTVSDYLAALRRRSKVFFLVAIPVLAIATVIALVLPNKYPAYARFDIDIEGAKTLESIDLTSYADQYVAKLRNRVFSVEKLRALAQDPDVFGSEFDTLSEPERIAKIREGLSVTIVTQPVMNPFSGREVNLISGFDVRSEGRDPEFTYQVAKNVASVFLAEDRLMRTERASSTSEFLREQIEQTEREIVSLEKEIADFKVANSCCLPELTSLNMGVIQRLEREIENLLPRVQTLEQKRDFLQTQLVEFRASNDTASRLSELEDEYLRLVANYGSDHPDVVRVRREISAIASAVSNGEDTIGLVDLRVRLAEAEQKYSAEHPDVLRYKRQISALEAKQAEGDGLGQARIIDDPQYVQLRNDLNALDTELLELRRRITESQQKIEEYENRLMKTPQVESEFQALDRKFQTARDNFQDLQGRLVIARQTEALESTEIGARLTEVRSAEIPQYPSGPPRMAIVIVGLFLACTLGAGLMILAELRDSTVRGGKDIAVLMDMVPLATIPVIGGAAGQSSHVRQLYLVSGLTVAVAVVLFLLYKVGIF